MPYNLLNNRYKIIGHTGFWIASITLMLAFIYLNEKQVYFDFITLTKAFIINAGFALGVYVNLYVLIPRFLKEKKYIFYIFWLIVLLTLSSLIIQFLLLFPLKNALNLQDNFTQFDTNLHSAYFFATLIYVAFTSFLKFINDWFKLQDVNLQLAKIEQQKLEAELNTLKSQLNPHFLFNSLNNIYSLALTNSEKVPDLILKLADLMRHIIYESKEKFIPLEKEIGFVNNFISMQKIRVPENVVINYEIKGAVPSSKIAPLLFEPFIDNAFKHGFPGSKNDFVSIRFDFSESGILKFYLENNYEEPQQWNKNKPGIGLSNVKQRLNLLYQPEEYNLEIKKENNRFAVFLQLKLK